MSQNVGLKIAGIMCLVFAFPIILVVIFLQALGIGEYVFPILVPIIIGLGATFCLIGLVFAFAARAERQKGVDLDRAVRAGYEAQMFAAGDYTRVYRPGATFSIPVYCPHCQSGIELDRVHWSGPQTLVCQECLNSVDVTLSEEI
ncbi:MAG: hypothetical protein ACE5H4_15325 [Candidatus Thorarchaeota archaeon]